MSTVRKALVTGAANPEGIGFGAARSLARDGYEVIVTGINQQEVDRTPSQAGFTSVILDVGDEDAVNALIGGLGRLDALVNCAGTADRNEFAMAGFERTVDVNLNGTMRCCLAAHDLLKASGGAIVNTASMMTTFGSPHVPAYAASKGGVGQLTKSLAVAWAKEGIRVNAIAPGFINTGMTKIMQRTPAMNDPIVARTPMGRWGEPDECGDVIAFLCSRAARFVNGQIIAVDGGYLACGI